MQPIVNARLLIDAIVRQTAVLVAQARIRATVAVGRGVAAVHGVTTDAERRAMTDASEVWSSSAFAWAAVRRNPG